MTIKVKLHKLCKHTNHRIMCHMQYRNDVPSSLYSCVWFRFAIVCKFPFLWVKTGQVVINDKSAIHVCAVASFCEPCHWHMKRATYSIRDARTQITNTFYTKHEINKTHTTQSFVLCSGTNKKKWTKKKFFCVLDYSPSGFIAIYNTINKWGSSIRRP